jgi:hypothetical protein
MKKGLGIFITLVDRLRNGRSTAPKLEAFYGREYP